MKYLALAFMFLYICSAEMDPKIEQKIDALRTREIGKTLFDTIQVQLGSSEPLDHLLDTLSNLEDQYQNDQKEDDSNNQQFQQQCDKDIDVFDKDVAVTETKKVQLQGVLDELNPILAQKKGTLAAKQEFKAELQKELDALDQHRNEEAEEFEQKRQEMQLVISVINEVKRIFETTSFSSSFLQGSNKVFTQVNQHFNKAAGQTSKQKFGKTFSHIFKFLASMTSKGGSSGLVDKIINLCDQLLKKVDESWVLERKAEDERVRVYETYKKLINKDMNQYNAQIANLESEIASLIDRIDNTTNNLNDVVDRINDKTNQRNDRAGECKEAAFDYAERRKNRQNGNQLMGYQIEILIETLFPNSSDWYMLI